MARSWGLPSDRSYWLLVGSVFLLNCGYGLWGPLWVPWSRELGASAQQVGLVLSVMGAGFVITTLPGGVLADLVGHKALLLMGWAVCAASVVPLIMARTWLGIMAAMALWGLGGVGGPAVMAYAAERAAPGSRGVALSVVTMVSPLARLLTGGVGGAMAQAWGIRVLFWVAAVLFGVATLLLLGLRPPRPGATRTPRMARPLENLAGLRRVMSLSAVFTLPYIFVFMSTGLVPVVYREIAHLNYREIGLLASVLAAGGVITSLLLGRVGDRAGHELSAAVGVCLAGLGILGPAIWRSFALLCVAAFIRACQEAVHGPMSAAVRMASGASDSGKGLGIYYFATALPMLFAPYLGGLLFELDPLLPFTVAGAGMLVTSVVMAAILVPRSGLPPRVSPRPHHPGPWGSRRGAVRSGPKDGVGPAADSTP